MINSCWCLIALSAILAILYIICCDHSRSCHVFLDFNPWVVSDLRWRFSLMHSRQPKSRVPSILWFRVTSILQGCKYRQEWSIVVRVCNLTKSSSVNERWLCWWHRRERRLRRRQTPISEQILSHGLTSPPCSSSLRIVYTPFKSCRGLHYWPVHYSSIIYT